MKSSRPSNSYANFDDVVNPIFRFASFVYFSIDLTGDSSEEESKQNSTLFVYFPVLFLFGRSVTLVDLYVRGTLSLDLVDLWRSNSRGF